MILRRITKHVKTQNWFAVALDFFIVVAGILIAFQITNWSEARQDRAEEIEYLYALQADVRASLEELEDQLRFLDLQYEAQKSLAIYSNDPNQTMTHDAIDKLIHVGVYELYKLEPQQVAFEELKNSGKLGLIQSAALRTKLQALQSPIAVVQHWEKDASEIYYRFSDPFLIEYYPMRGVVHLEPNRNGFSSTPWLDPAEDRSETLAILKSEKFQNILLYRGNIGAGVRESTSALRPLYNEIDALIADRMIALGETR